MSIHSTVINQCLIMFCMIGIGYYIYSKQWLDENGAQQISNILLKICGPFIVIITFNIPFNLEMLKGLLVTFGLSIILFTVSLSIAWMFFKDPEQRIEKFSVAFPNAGFIGIPLVNNILGTEYVFYLSAYLLAFNIFSWTIGVYMISGRRDLVTPRLILTSPAVIGMVCGLIIFFSPFKLSGVLYTTINYIGSINTPLAMIVLGTYIAKTNIMSLFTERNAYKVSLIRLLIIPLVSLGILTLFKGVLLEIRMVLLIATSAPVGVVVAMFAQRYRKDYNYGARIVSLSTLISLVTIPAIVMLGKWIWTNL